MKQGLTKDRKHPARIPRNHRSYFGADLSMYKSNTDGLEAFNCIASAQFTELEFIHAIKGHDPDKIYVFDLRSESHWLFDGIPYAWYQHHNNANQGKVPMSIYYDEVAKKELWQSQRKAGFFDSKYLKDQKSGPSKGIKWFGFKRVETEAEMVRRHGCHYYRLHAVDHIRASDTIIQEFINIRRTLPDDAILFFHCRAGRGRTTSFLVLHDILLNAKNVSFDDIIARHAEFGPKNLKDTSSLDGLERYNTLKNFYAYVQDGHYKAGMSWLDYVNIFIEPQNMLLAHNLVDATIAELIAEKAGLRATRAKKARY